MEKVCIIFLIVLLTLTLLWANDIQVKISDILFSFALFIFLYNLIFYIGKYIKVRKERQKFELIIKSLEKCIEQQNIR